MAGNLGGPYVYPAVTKNHLWKILAVNRYIEGDRHVTKFAVIDLNPGLRPVFVHQGTDIYVLDKTPAAGFHAHSLANTHGGRAMVPSQLRFVITEAGGAVKFIPIQSVAVDSAQTPHENMVVLHLDQQCVVAQARVWGKIKFERGKKPLV